MNWEQLKIPLLISAIIVFLISLYSFIIRTWKHRARVGEYPYLHGQDTRKIKNEMTIVYELPYADKVDLNILDAQEKLLFSLVSERKEKGKHQITFDTSEMQKGAYFYQLDCSNQNNLKRFEKV